MWKTKDELRIVSAIAEAFNLNFEELEFSTKFNKDDIDMPIQKLEKGLGVKINKLEIENIVNVYQLVIFLKRLLSKEELLDSVDYYVDGSISVYMNSDNHDKFKQKQIADWKEKNMNLSMTLMITPLCPSIGYYVNVGDIQIPKDVLKTSHTNISIPYRTYSTPYTKRYFFTFHFFALFIHV